MPVTALSKNSSISYLVKLIIHPGPLNSLYMLVTTFSFSTRKTAMIEEIQNLLFPVYADFQGPTKQLFQMFRNRLAPIFKSDLRARSEEHTSELQSLMRISYAVFCLKKKNIKEHKSKLQTINTYNDTRITV